MNLWRVVTLIQAVILHLLQSGSVSGVNLFLTLFVFVVIKTLVWASGEQKDVHISNWARFGFSRMQIHTCMNPGNSAAWAPAHWEDYSQH